MKDFVYREIWLPVLVNDPNDWQAFTGGVPLVPIGGEIMFRIALFDTKPVDLNNKGEFRNHTNLASVALRIHQVTAGVPGATVLDSLVDGIYTLDTTATEETFINKQKAPVNIYFSDVKTAGVAANTLFAKLHGITNESAARDIFGWGNITFKDVGALTAGQPTAGDPDYFTADEIKALLNNKVNYGKNLSGKYPIMVSPNGKKGRPYGVDDNGNPLANLQTYP